MHEIRYSSEFNEEFVKLQLRAEKGNSEAKQLLELIAKATAKLAVNREAGTKLPKKLWPVEYVQKYGANNLWKINLDGNWRLLYTITGQEVSLFLIYLEWMLHKDYERKFGFKRS